MEDQVVNKNKRVFRDISQPICNQRPGLSVEIIITFFSRKTNISPTTKGGQVSEWCCHISIQGCLISDFPSEINQVYLELFENVNSLKNKIDVSLKLVTSI